MPFQFQPDPCSAQSAPSPEAVATNSLSLPSPASTQQQLRLVSPEPVLESASPRAQPHVSSHLAHRCVQICGGYDHTQDPSCTAMITSPICHR
ncbi:hypothetical protein M0R45_019498 [Rubus argutus]|uniref:Uncharacterized protein n=1 Tax=Rubus argutus TaxID=59490 RepID=A0AAW1X940_RUBAR